MDPTPDASRLWATLLRAPQLNAARLLKACAQLGAAEALVGLPYPQLLSLGFSPDCAKFLNDPPARELDADLAWLNHSGAKLVHLQSEEYPAALLNSHQPPLALYVLGDAKLLSARQVALVGSRQTSAIGYKFAAKLAQGLTDAGFAITSGLARGVDTAAHEGALTRGKTIAVCGTGLDLTYPQENAALAKRIAVSGALVSEFPPGTAARPFHFPRRNRIIAALAQGTVVVEAAARSGALITAQMALEEGREVFAVPGHPLNPQAAGCLSLLQDGAHMACQAQDIIDLLTGLSADKSSLNQILNIELPTPLKPERLDNDYEMLLDALGFEPASIDDLVDRTGLSPGAIASMLLILKLDGKVETRPGAFFSRV